MTQQSENQSTQTGTTSTKPKIAFAQRAAHARRVEELIDSPSTSPGQVETPTPIPHSKVGIPSSARGPGRPSKLIQPEIKLPVGLQVLRRGRYTWTDELGEQFIEAYYESGGSLTRACRKANVKYTAAMEWRDTKPEFAQALREIDQIIKDEIHSQFMERVLTTWEPNPSWKFKYFNKHFPEYSDSKKSVKVTFQLKDTLIKPDFIEGEVIKPKQLETENARPEQPMETPPNTS